MFIFVEGTDHSAMTDENGTFALTMAENGPVVLRFDDRYAFKRLELSVEDRRGRIVVSLSKSSKEKSSITVIAVRSQPETVSTTRISAREISSAPRRNAEEVLRQVPGLMLVQHGSEGKGHQFFMRGFDAVHGADLELTVDGALINEWSNVHAQGYLDLAMIIPEMIQSIKVTKGPFTLDQGAFGMAGSVDYHLGLPSEEHGWRTAYTMGTTNRHRLFVSYAPTGHSNDHFMGVAVTHDEDMDAN